MISLYKINMAAPGQFNFINSETFRQYSVGIETVFATISDTPTKNLGVLVQPSADGQTDGRFKEDINIFSCDSSDFIDSIDSFDSSDSGDKSDNLFFFLF